MNAKRPIALPDRRLSRCEPVRVAGRTFFLHCGFDVDGAVREIFVSSKQASSELAWMLEDTCIGISYRLQYGPRLAEIEVRGEVMQAVIARAIEIEREEAAGVIAEYAAAGLVVAA
jgi:hypothetical protein